jgi:hypothetical protein
MKKNASETHQFQIAGNSGKMGRLAVCRDFQHEKKDWLINMRSENNQLKNGSQNPPKY